MTTKSIVWHDFGYENDREGRGPDLKTFEGIDPFTFEKVQYIRKLEEGIQRLRREG